MSVYLTFDEMREALGLSEDELKRLVSEGEVRAFRRGSRMVFRASDLDDLRHRLRHDADPPLRAERQGEHVERIADRVVEPEAPARPSEAAPPADGIPVARLAEEEDSPEQADAEPAPGRTGSESPTPPAQRRPQEVRDAARRDAVRAPTSSVSPRDVAYVLLIAALVAALLALFA